MFCSSNHISRKWGESKKEKAYEIKAAKIKSFKKWLKNCANIIKKKKK